MVTINPEVKKHFEAIFLDGQSTGQVYNIKTVSKLSFDQAVPKYYINMVKEDLKNQGFHINMENILLNLTLLTAPYFSFKTQDPTAVDKTTIYIGQVVIHKSIQEDLIDFFSCAFKLQFPIGLLRPLAHDQFISPIGKWSDKLSMKHNNSYSFNLRKIADKPLLSLHSYGLAIDFNPIQNPCIYDHNGYIEPENGIYDPSLVGTFGLCSTTNDSGKILTELLISKGWTWGKYISNKKDYHHFQKEKILQNPTYYLPK